ncbi:hypothetical protein GCM10025876_21870 [Demequina litorisediminis]|uniref:Uncharacterized protein n=1 Tax=Demequina litorisediminis TaxID=1849022 RepID=A0ABQ6IFS3_9MICO|nr:hypothetical protein GCM10025876_21870 [Demequina litorisediminis]
MDLVLTAQAECLPANLVNARPAPKTLPDNPLATASPEPSASPKARRTASSAPRRRERGDLPVG